MAKRKEDPKPLFGLKHDFYASLDNVLQETINLMQMVGTVVDLGNLPEPIKTKLAERNEALRKALMSDE